MVVSVSVVVLCLVLLGLTLPEFFRVQRVVEAEDIEEWRKACRS